jgi:hypothetical protein
LYSQTFQAARRKKPISPAVIEDLFAAPVPAVTNTPPKLLPALDVQTYRIEGNTVLPPEEFGMLSNYTGKVDVSHVREGLDKLQSLYRESGHPESLLLYRSKKSPMASSASKSSRPALKQSVIWPLTSPIFSSHPKAENRRLKCVAIRLKVTRLCPSQNLIF